MSFTNQLIINNPYEMPRKYLKYIREIRKFEVIEGRRPAGYVIATQNSKSFDDPEYLFPCLWSPGYAKG